MKQRFPNFALSKGETILIKPVDIAAVVTRKHAKQEPRLHLCANHLDTLADVPRKEGRGELGIQGTERRDGLTKVGPGGVDTALRQVFISDLVFEELQALLD